jgi:hypothetical protein
MFKQLVENVDKFIKKAGGIVCKNYLTNVMVILAAVASAGAMMVASASGDATRRLEETALANQERPEVTVIVLTEVPFEEISQTTTAAPEDPADHFEEPYTPPGFQYHPEIPLSYDLQKYTYERCLEVDLEYEMVLAVMWRESTFRLDTVSINRNGTQDSGLMQINDVNRGWLYEQHGISDLFDPYQNIDAGTLILSRLFEKYENEKMALIGYQFGESGMLRAWENGTRTTPVSRDVQQKRDEFREMMQAL